MTTDDESKLSAQSTQQLFGGMTDPKMVRPTLPPPENSQKTEELKKQETTSSAPSSPAVVGETGTAALHDFELHDKLGAGGNAAVYVATWKKTGERVALKIIHGDLAADPKYLARFQREVKASSLLQHKNICRVHAWGITDGKLFLAMELIEGGTVRDLIDRAEKLPAPVAASLVAQLLDALQCAHDAGILHRDVKPANAMVTRSGVLKLVDFGIAKGQDDATVTETGFLVGTPAYMSPEQAIGREIDHRTDLYAAGVCFYEMLVGENPYANDSPSHALLRIAQEPMPSVFEQDATVPGIVEAVLERLVERNRDARYSHAKEAVADLRPYLAFVDEVNPDLLTAFVADPVNRRTALLAEQAELELARAERLLLAGEVNFPAAALALFRASSLNNTIQIAHRFEHVCARGSFSFGKPDDGDLVKARAALTTSATPAGPLKRLADLYRAKGDIHRAVVFLRRYLRERPTDSHAQHQLELMVAGVPAPELTAQGKLQTRDILAGVKTGGWSAVTPEKKELALSLLQPKPSVRTSVKGEPLPRPGLSGQATSTSTAVIYKPPQKKEEQEKRERIASAARELRKGPQGTGDESLGDVVSSAWQSYGRHLAVAAVFLGAFALVVYAFQKVVDTSVSHTQRVVGDNTAAVGKIEENDINRKRDNELKDALAHESAGQCDKAIHDVGTLLTMNPPASMALDALLIRARCRVVLLDRRAARRDFEQFLAESPLTDPRRADVKQRLENLNE